MRRLPEIVALYGQLDALLEAQREEALKAKDIATVERVERRQLINDHAYFVLCFGQLELEINDRCADLIRRRKADQDWSRRRGFDMYDADNLRLSFEARTALLVDASAGPEKPFRRIMKFMDLRNKAAHGKFDDKGIDVAEIANEFRTLAGLLAP
ncbi:MAG: hypothetical protein ACHQF3_11710 [Alphaproteobacteria bacterium]